MEDQATYTAVKQTPANKVKAAIEAHFAQDFIAPHLPKRKLETLRECMEFAPDSDRFFEIQFKERLAWEVKEAFLSELSKLKMTPGFPEFNSNYDVWLNSIEIECL